MECNGGGTAPGELGSRYHDGKPGRAGKDWWGTVTGDQPPGSIHFHHTIRVSQLRATVEVHIHYSFEKMTGLPKVIRWLVLDIAMPIVLRPLKTPITSTFDKENARTLAAVKEYAEASKESASSGQCRGSATVNSAAIPV